MNRAYTIYQVDRWSFQDRILISEYIISVEVGQHGVCIKKRGSLYSQKELSCLNINLCLDSLATIECFVLNFNQSKFVLVYERGLYQLWISYLRIVQQEVSS